MGVDALSDIYEKNLGSCGCWQATNVILVFASKFAVGWHQILMVISQPRPEFTCSNASLDKCASDCPSHEFDRSIFKETVITQWDLVCQNEWIANLIQTIVMLGILVGNTSFGYFADKFGRRIPLVAAIILQVIAGVLAAFSPWLWGYVLLRFLTTVSTGGTMLVAFVLLMELTVEKHRTPIGVLFQLPFQMGHGTLGVIGYFFRDWKSQQLVVSVPQILLLSYCCLLPESPRWLLTMGKVDKAIKTIERGAKCNRKPIDNIRSDIESNMDSLVARRAKGGNMVDLFRTSRMRKKMLCQCINWFVIALDFFGMAQFIGYIGGNIFLNITIAGFLQLPGNILCIFLMDKFGRKVALILSFVMCFVPCFGIAVLPKEPVWPFQTLACIGMVGISMSFSIIYVYSGEMFPTVIRNVAMGVLSMIARFGSMLAPHITYLDRYHPCIPPLILGIFPVISSLFTLIFLPETLNLKMPDTIEEADEL